MLTETQILFSCVISCLKNSKGGYLTEIQERPKIQMHCHFLNREKIHSNLQVPNGLVAIRWVHRPCKSRLPVAVAAPIASCGCNWPHEGKHLYL